MAIAQRVSVALRKAGLDKMTRHRAARGVVRGGWSTVSHGGYEVRQWGDGNVRVDYTPTHHQARMDHLVSPMRATERSRETLTIYRLALEARGYTCEYDHGAGPPEIAYRYLIVSGEPT